MPCIWCPFDQSCHTRWSPRNDCLIQQSLNKQSQCDARDSGNFSYDPEEAYKLALFSAIAYSDEPSKCLERLFPKSDYTIFSILLKKCDNFFFDYDKQCLAFVTFSHRNKEIIVAYRGTRGIKQTVDQVLTVLSIPSVPSAVGGKVQKYFNNVHNKLYHSIKYLVQDLIQWFPKCTVKLTGHSLGGAAASITSAMLVKDGVLKPSQTVLYTFGMPRVGNKHYAFAHDKLVPNSWRVVRNGDPVARLPFCSLATCSIFDGPYHHGTKVLYTGSKMDRNAKYVICQGNEDSRLKCLQRHRKKRAAMDRILENHKVYFDIPIGTYCRDHILN